VRGTAEEIRRDFHYTPEEETFRQNIRAWLATTLLPDRWVEDALGERVPPDRETCERRLVWHKKLYAAGWADCPGLREDGGHGASLMGR
jgi:alkylation response protein AidB-like acyl-CoA dehydrogenase